MPTEDFSSAAAPVYVTHTKCDSIVEIAQIDDDVALYVYCPTCQDIVEGGELSNEACYLVAMPEPAPPVNSTDNSPIGSEP